jgi:hypothetical protein
MATKRNDLSTSNGIHGSRKATMIEVYASCTDTTSNTILDRRISFVKNLASAVAPANEWNMFWQTLAQKLESASVDLEEIGARYRQFAEHAHLGVIHLNKQEDFEHMEAYL